MERIAGRALLEGVTKSACLWLVLLGSVGCAGHPPGAPRAELATEVKASPEARPSPPVLPAPASAIPSASSAPPGAATLPCLELGLFSRYEASPRSEAFDAAARAFDSAMADYRDKRYAEAARGFMAAAKSFLDEKDLDDRRWSYGNAVTAWEKANRLEEARAALVDAADRDAELAEQLRSMAAGLHSACPDR